MTVDISRGYLHKSLSTTMEFIVESDKGEIVVFYVLFATVFLSPIIELNIFFLAVALIFSADLLERSVSSEMAIFYITQDTQRHPLLPELKSGLLLIVCPYSLLSHSLI